MFDLSGPAGTEIIVDAYGCDEHLLRQKARLEQIVVRVVTALGLSVVREPIWHQFPEPGGLTGMVLLAESHLCMHTFPERQYASVNLYCCRPKPDWAWEKVLTELLGAREVVVRSVVRGRAAVPDSAAPVFRAN
jgi:S-adenosylmethionine decarboxylase